MAAFFHPGIFLESCYGIPEILQIAEFKGLFCSGNPRFD